MKLGRFFERDENLLVIMGLLGGVALALTALAVYAFILPESETRTETLAQYEHTGRYSYSVATEPSAINPSETIGPVLPETIEDSGQPPPPIFTRLARGLEFIYAYQLQGASNVSGTISADLEIKAGDNWSDRLPLAEPAPFEGASGGVEGTIDFAQIAALLTQVEEQTGVSSSSVELTILPTVDVQATVNGQQIEETYSSPLTFTYTSNLITPGETLSFSEPQTITTTTRTENYIEFLGGSVLVSTVRDIATPLALATLALTGVFAAIFFLGVGRSETAMVRSRYRGLIVPVADVESAASHRISVGSLLDLAQLAKRENRSLFLREFDNGAQAYLMHDGMVIYQYAVGDVPRGWIRSPLTAAQVEEPPAAPVAEPAVTVEPPAAAFDHEVVVSHEETEPAPAQEEPAAIDEPAAEAEMPAAAVEDDTALFLQTVEEIAAPAQAPDPAIEAESAAASEPVEAIETPAFADLPPEADTVEPESIPEWLFAPYEHDEQEEAVEEAASPVESNGVHHEELPAAFASIESNGASHIDEDESVEELQNAPEVLVEAEESEIVEAVAEQPTGDPADLAWRRPTEAVAGTEPEAEPEAPVEETKVVAEVPVEEPVVAIEVPEEPQPVEAEVSAEVSIEEPQPVETVAEPVASAAEAYSRTADHARGSAPRRSVRRWLRNRSGGPLLDEHHPRRQEQPAAEANGASSDSQAVASVEPEHASQPEVIDDARAESDAAELELELAALDADAALSEPEEIAPTFEADLPADSEVFAEPEAVIESAPVEPAPEAREPEAGASQAEAPSPPPSDDEVVAAVDVAEVSSQPESAAAAGPESLSADVEAQPVSAEVGPQARTAEAYASQSATPRRRPQTFDRKLTGFARRWLRDFLDYQPEERRNRR